MLRRLFTFGSAASFLLFAAAAVSALRGVWRTDWASYAGDAHTVMVASIGSSVWLTFWSDAEPPGGWAVGSDPAVRPYFEGPPADFRGMLGAGLDVGRTNPSATARLGGNRPYGTLIVPHWLLAAAAVPLPVLWVRRHRRAASRIAGGCCRRCGYDLRATPDRCPECGAVPEGVV